MELILCTAAPPYGPVLQPAHLSMKLGERGEEMERLSLKAPLILAHLLLFLIQLIKALIRLTLTPSGNDEWAAGEAEQGSLRAACVACG